MIFKFDAIFVFVSLLYFRNSPLIAISIISFNLFAVNIPDRDSTGVEVKTSSTFASKENHFFRGHGSVFTAAANTTTNMEYALMHAKAKFNGAEIIGTNVGDKVNFKILDTATGTYSTIPNHLLNQFGFNWNMKNDSHKEILPYVSNLYMGMRILIEYTNAGAAKTIGVNYYLHEEI